MANLAVQIGHVNGKAGAAYEEQTLLLVVPHIEARLRNAGHQVTHFDGSLQNEPGNYQHDHDGAVFVHCDSGGNRSTFSIGYWEERHPSSGALAGVLKEVYAAETGIKFDAYNITSGEHHYYGNRRFSTRCKCVLIELGFVSNPTQRAWLQANAQRVGYAVANAFIKFFGGAVEQERTQEVDDMPVRVSEERAERFPAWLKHSEGKVCYLDLVDASEKATGAKCRLSLRGDDGNAAPPDTVKEVTVPKGATKRINVGELWKIPETDGWTVIVEVLSGGPVDVWRRQN